MYQTISAGVCTSRASCRSDCPLGVLETYGSLEEEGGSPARGQGPHWLFASYRHPAQDKVPNPGTQVPPTGSEWSHGDLLSKGV